MGKRLDRHRVTRSLMAMAIAMLLLFCAGCGSESDSGAAKEPQTVTEVKTVTEPAPEKKAPKQPSSDDSADSGTGSIKVPDVVGKDHQLAQDTMQAAGLYLLDEQDATGQGRALLYDRNWTVVEQDPPAGTRVSEDETITLRSKKDGE